MNLRSSRPLPTAASILPLCLVALLALAPRANAQEPGTPKTLTIDQAVQIALDRNPTVRLAQTQVVTNSAHVNGAFGSFLPRIDVQGGYTKQLDADQVVLVQGIPIASSRPDYSYNAGASATLTLFDGFTRSANYSSARKEFDASVESLERTRQNIAQQVRVGFLNALRAEQVLEIRNADLELSRERLVQERERMNAGAGLATSVYTQEAEVANNELSLEQARTDLLVARNTLTVMLNYDPVAKIQLSSEGLANSVDSTEMIAERQRLGSVEEMLKRQAEHRRDIYAAKLKVESAASQVAAARGGYYPSLSTSLGYNWQKSGGTDASSSTTFSLNLQYSPFDGFRTSEQVQVAEAGRQSAELELRKLELDARSELEGALARLDGAERQVRAAGKAVTAARQSRYAADERFKAGVGGYTDYLLANSQYITAQVNQVNAVFNYRMALYEVNYHLGN